MVLFYQKHVQEARALLGRLEYQRGNLEGALRVFDGIDLQAAIQRLQPIAEKQASKKGRPRTESMHTISQHAASLVLEAIYLKAKSLQKLGRVTGMELFNHVILDIDSPFGSLLLPCPNLYVKFLKSNL